MKYEDKKIIIENSTEIDIDNILKLMSKSRYISAYSVNKFSHKYFSYENDDYVILFDKSINDSIDINEDIEVFDKIVIDNPYFIEKLDTEHSGSFKSYNKLVRNKVPNIIIEKGGTCEITKSKDFMKDVEMKLNFEINEFLKNDILKSENLIDLIGTLTSILSSLDKNYDLITIFNALENNLKYKGDYSEHIILNKYSN